MCNYRIIPVYNLSNWIKLKFKYVWEGMGIAKTSVYSVTVANCILVFSYLGTKLLELDFQ